MADYDNKNIIKVRDDFAPISFDKKDESFELRDASLSAAWPPQSRFDKSDIRKRVEPWLTALFQSEHLSLIAGSGLTHAVHRIATGKNATGMEQLKFNQYQSEIAAAVEASAKITDRANGNFEDQLRVANELLRGLEILKKDEDARQLGSQLDFAMGQFAKSILRSEAAIASASNESREEAFNTLITFLMSFAR